MLSISTLTQTYTEDFIRSYPQNDDLIQKMTHLRIDFCGSILVWFMHIVVRSQVISEIIENVKKSEIFFSELENFFRNDYSVLET